jgi:hypothetical protein
MFKLYGYKWFSSATDSDVSLTLARITDTEGSTIQGTRGLSLFFLKTRLEDNRLNDIQIVKLKDKLGTRQLPTAELLLDGTQAIKMSTEGRGVAEIASMLQVTRVHNAIAATAAMRRMLMAATDYAEKRVAFGRTLSQHPVHMQTLARMELEARAAFVMVIQAAKLLGRHDSGCASDEDKMMLRILTPLVKLYTAKQAMSVVSEGLEAFGGQGYIEETGIPIALRDAQVLPIWEGTTNVLAMDVLRVLSKTNGEALLAFHSVVKQKLETALNDQELREMAEKIVHTFQEMVKVLKQNPMLLEAGARDFAYSLARIYSASCLLEMATRPQAIPSDIIAAKRWSTSQDLCPFLTNHGLGQYEDEAKKGDTSLLLQ